MSDTKKPTDIVAAESNNLAVPEWMAQFSADGAGDIDPNSIRRPFLKIIQKTSGEFDQKLADMGDFYISTSAKNYGREVVFSIVKIAPPNWRVFGKDNKLAKSSKDGITWDDGTRVTADETWQKKFLDMFIVIKGESMPCIFSFKSTNYKVGQKLQSMLASFCKGNGEPIYGRNYTLYTFDTKGESGTYADLGFKLNPGFNTQEDMIALSKIRKEIVDAPVVIPQGEEHYSESIDASFSSEPLDID